MALRAILLRNIDAPERASARLALAELLARSGRLDAAAEQYPAALSLDPANVAARTNYGLVLLRLGRAQQAVAQLQESVRRDPTLPEPRNVLAEALLKRDPDNYHRRTCLDALVNLEQPQDSQSALLAALEDDDAEVRLRAAKGLKKILGPALVFWIKVCFNQF